MQSASVHSSITVTLDRYGHPFPSLEEPLIAGPHEVHRDSAAEFSRSRDP